MTKSKQERTASGRQKGKRSDSEAAAGQWDQDKSPK